MPIYHKNKTARRERRAVRDKCNDLIIQLQERGK